MEILLEHSVQKAQTQWGGPVIVLVALLGLGLLSISETYNADRNGDTLSSAGSTYPGPSAGHTATPHPGSLIYSQRAGNRHRHDETPQHLRAGEVSENGLAVASGRTYLDSTTRAEQ